MFRMPCTRTATRYPAFATEINGQIPARTRRSSVINWWWLAASRSRQLGGATVVISSLGRCPVSAVDATTPVAVDKERLEQLVNGVLADAGGAFALPLALIGDRPGLFEGLVEHGTATAAQLAEAGGTSIRYVQEWLLAMAVAGYVDHRGEESGAADPATARYRMAPEQAEIFTNPDSAHYMVGMFQNITAATRMVDRLTEAFRTGEVLAGTSTTTTCPSAPNGSSGRPT